MAKKQYIPTTRPVAETYVHIFTGKVQVVSVNVHINYVEGHITLVDYNPGNPGATQAKQWKFGKREVEFMAGWLDILDAMKSAITEAKEKLEAYQKEEEDRKDALIIEAAKAQMQ